MIIIEGCDKTGKTTLAKILADRLKFQYVKEGVPPLDGFRYYVGRSLKLGWGTVVDRFHLGEMVYPVIKNDSRATLQSWQQHLIERSLGGVGTILVLCVDDSTIIKRRFVKLNEDFIASTDVVKTLRLFNRGYRNSILPKLMYNINPNTDLDYIIELHDQVTCATDKLRCLEFSGTAYDHPLIMLVGDRYADGKYVGAQRPHRCFISSNNSSTYLHQALDRDALKRWRGHFYLTNARKHVSDMASILDLEAEIDCLKPAAIIALGANAARALKVISVNHETVDHPQYWRRFKYHQIDAYANNIKEAIYADSHKQHIL